MLSPNDAKRLVEQAHKDAKAVDVAEYQGDYLVRVEFADPHERHYDPFFRVHSATGLVEEFSVITDGDPVEVAAAFAK